MDKSVREDLPLWNNKRLSAALEGEEYDAYVNSHGALCAIFADGDMIGLKPGEFTVVGWHPQKEGER